ncbi:DUF418 domain-containing protein [Noviherbaspirillum sp. CPCC 100848]|uniref:DUF418 domain-containing protein n=1 Tax=Noviherbaspirillum album TaxID=3080276 RepID=A0ABU6J2E9_9BURK|nr:DUF418 domain-containing protein [Noviherbaspirillum sp. CPCC 100848]MEC4717782.1 DUF418 domain-containing protein [Noviherbaspirillum sp. CPCC 100848]
MQQQAELAMPAQETDVPIRYAHIDVLRGIAVFGILVVNIWSFVWGFGSLRYGVLPDQATFVDKAAIFGIAFLAEQKFYPIFAFLFGAGLALQGGPLESGIGERALAQRRYRRRLAGLLGLGIIHGTLVWGGDILTIYGSIGFLIVGLAGAQRKAIGIQLWNWTVVWLTLIACNIAMALTAYADSDPYTLGARLIGEARSAHLAYAHGSPVRQFLQRLFDYAAVTMNSLFMVPHVLVLFLLGLYSVRAGWLTEPQRHAGLWRRVRLTGYAFGIPFNLLWAWVVLRETSNPFDANVFGLTVYSLLPLGGSLLAAAYVATVMLAAGRRSTAQASRLAPVGRMALTNYLAQSAFGVLLLQAVGLGWGRHVAEAPALLLPLLALIMVCQTAFSRWWLSKHAQGPLERLMARYVRRSG